MKITFTLPCRPATKKTSNRVVFLKGHPRVLPSKQYTAWFRDAMSYAPIIRQAIEAQGVALPLMGDVKVSALIYRARNAGDLNGFQQAIGDWLQAPTIIKSGPRKGQRGRNGAGIIGDDRQIVSWDGSMLLKDAARPRTEICIEFAAAQRPMHTGVRTRAEAVAKIEHRAPEGK